MVEWSENYARVNDLNIHYYRTGGADKPQVILLHGVMDNGLCWTPVARDLQEHFDVIMTDARGHGHTGGPLESFSYNQLAADVAGLIGVLDLEKPYLFGHSMGAMTSIAVAANYPDLVRAVVLEDPPFIDKPLDQAEEERPEESISAFFQAILNLKTMSQEERLLTARKYNPIWDEVELAPWAESKVEFNPEVFQYLQGAFSWRELLPIISCPILLVTGDPEARAIVTPQAAEEATHLWHNGAVIRIAGAGHCIHRDCYAETMPLIQNWLSRV